jgi:phytoene/squalene synthetase
MISIALYDMQNRIPVSKTHFERMVRGRLDEQDLISWMTFDRYVDDNYTMMYYILLEMFNARGEDEFKAATFAGRAFGIADILRRTNYFLKSGRNYFPVPLMKKFGISEQILSDDIENNVRKVPEQFYDCVLELAQYGKKNLESARELIPSLKKNSSLLFLPTVEADIYFE